MATRSQVENLSVTELSEFLSTKLSGKVSDPDYIVTSFSENHINGLVFLEMNDNDLKEVIAPLGDRKAVRRLIDSYNITLESRHGAVTKVTSAEGWESSFEIPPFSFKTQDALDNKKVTKSVRVDVVATIAYKMWSYTQFPTRDQYNVVCAKIVAKYPVLKDTVGTPYGSLKIQLRQKMKNMRRPADLNEGETRKRPRSETQGKENSSSNCNSKKRATIEVVSEHEDDSYEENLANLCLELDQDKPRSKRLKKFMKKTFQGRWKWIKDDGPAVIEVLSTFQCLKQSKYLQRDLLMIAQLDSLYTVDEKWKEFATKVEKQTALEASSSTGISSLLKQKEEEMKAIVTEEDAASLQAVYVFHMLELLLIPKSKDKLLISYPVSTDLDREVSKENRNDPHIVVVKGDAVQFFICVERLILVESTSFVEAIKDLIAAYYVFNIQYPRPLNPMLMFLQRYILNIKDGQRIPPVVTRVLSALDQ